jgi:hypothetical protein
MTVQFGSVRLVAGSGQTLRTSLMSGPQVVPIWKLSLYLHSAQYHLPERDEYLMVGPSNPME